MVTFSYPIYGKRAEEGGPGSLRVPMTVRREVTGNMTGSAVGVTTLPLATAPAGAYVRQINVFVPTGFANGAGNVTMNVRYGNTVVAAVTANVEGVKTWSPTAAQTSVAVLNTTAPTTIDVVVSIDTAALTNASTARAVIFVEVI